MNIVFTERAEKVFQANTWKRPSLNEKIISLMRWHGNGTINISQDGEKSFFFQEIDKDGKPRMCGGIIFHRNYKKDSDGNILRDENGRAILSHEDDGEYSIHT